MFNNNVRFTVETRTENEDNIKIEKLMDTYKAPRTMLGIRAINDGRVRITMTTSKRCMKDFVRDLNLLNYIGIKGEIEV